MLTLGMDLGQGNTTDIKEALLPLRDLALLWKATSLEGWTDQSKSWDKLISNARLRSENEKISIEELRRVKKELYEITHGEYKNTAKDR